LPEPLCQNLFAKPGLLESAARHIAINDGVIIDPDGAGVRQRRVAHRAQYIFAPDAVRKAVDIVIGE
jgi:hypothetical protein